MKIVFMGTPDFTVPILDALFEAGHTIALVVSMPDAPVGRKQTMKAPPAKEWAIRHDIPVFQPKRIRDPEAVETLRGYGADIFVVAAYGQILPSGILSMPRFGCVNIHASILPKYRGASPIQWAILNGDEETGITIMQMGEGLDDGDILLQKTIPIAPEETGGSLFDKLAALGGEAITEALPRIEEGSLIPRKQEESAATKVGKIEKSLGKLDFGRPAAELERYVRGLSPWPGTYCLFRGGSLKILEASEVSDPSLSSPEGRAPGETVEASRGSWIVAAGEGALALKKVQPAGKKPMEVEAYLRGYRVQPGERLD